MENAGNGKSELEPSFICAEHAKKKKYWKEIHGKIQIMLKFKFPMEAKKVL